jgi:tRNA 2-selenouridine synthase
MHQANPDVPVATEAHPAQLEVLEWNAYDLVIDARSPHEYDDDHIPGAVNLPVVDDAQYAVVGTAHKHDPHSAYLAGVEYSLQNIARQLPYVARVPKEGRMLVYCFRGGKRSKLWADNLQTIGYRVDLLRGGWKRYRRWVIAALESLPCQLSFRVISGSTGCGKTRLLYALREVGEQVVDLEGLARHRGSLIGALPGVQQPSQKLFDSLLLQELRGLSVSRVVWIEAESKRIGRLQLPESLYRAMQSTMEVRVAAPMRERVRLWREDYPHLADDPVHMVRQLAPLKPLIGGQELIAWEALANNGQVDELFARVMSAHYDPCYERSSARTHSSPHTIQQVELPSLLHLDLLNAARSLAASVG